MDLRLERAISGKSRWKLVSAEGCYSNAVINTGNIRVKYAVKGMSDVRDQNDDSFEYGLTIGKGKSGYQRVIYKAKQKNDSSVEDYFHLSKTWFEEDEKYKSHELQWGVGEMIEIEQKSKQEPGCMYWTRKEYQTDLCYDGISSSETVFLINGALYKQAFQEMTFPRGISSKAFFHFQEWKRSYKPSQLLSFSRFEENNRKHLGWQLFEEGAIPLYSNQRRDVNTRSKISLLPPTQFCLQFIERRGNERASSCSFSASWSSHNIVTFESKGWWEIDSAGITLILTLRLDTCIHPDSDQVLLDVLESNTQWQQAPAVILIYVSGSKDRYKAVERRMNQMISNLSQYLVGIVYNDRDGCASHHAVLNMAEAARKTRWIVSGLDIERGYLMSREILYFSQKAISEYASLSKTVFILPQISLNHELLAKNEEPIHKSPLPISIGDILEEFESSEGLLFTNAAKPDSNICHESDEDVKSIEHQINNIWIKMSIYEAAGSKSALTTHEVNSLAHDLVSLQRNLAESLHKNSNMNFHQRPLLLLDTNESDKFPVEIIELPEGCAKAMRLVHLSALDYQILVVPGAFASSNPYFKPSSFYTARLDCAMCNLNHVKDTMMKHNILIAKTAALYYQNNKL